MIQQIVFDVDGTLIDTEEAVLVSLQETLRALCSKEYKTEDLRFALGIPGEAALKQLNIADIHQGWLLWNKKIQNHYHTMKVFDGIIPVLEELKEAGYRLGVITSKNAKEVRDEFMPYGIAHYFDHIISADDSETHKPEPGPMLEYLKRAGAEAKETVYIGDTVYDMKCAQAAGTFSMLALWGCRQSEGIVCDWKVSIPQEILKTVKGGIQNG